MSDARSTAPPRPPPRGRVVWTLILITLLFFLGMFATLYRQAVKNREPDFEVLVTGPSYFDGAVITIESATAERKLSATFGEKERREIPFFLPAGHYTLSAKRPGLNIRPLEFSLPPKPYGKVVRCDLQPPPGATTQP